MVIQGERNRSDLPDEQHSPRTGIGRVAVAPEHVARRVCGRNMRRSDLVTTHLEGAYVCQPRNAQALAFVLYLALSLPRTVTNHPISNPLPPAPRRKALGSTGAAVVAPGIVAV